MLTTLSPNKKECVTVWSHVSLATEPIPLSTNKYTHSFCGLLMLQVVNVERVIEPIPLSDFGF